MPETAAWRQKPPRTKKIFTSGGLKLQETSTKKATNAYVIEALEAWLDQLKSDGRGRRAA